MIEVSGDEQPVYEDGRWSCAGLVHDATRWPLVTVTFPNDGPEPAWKAFLAHVELCFDDEWREQHGYTGRHATILDISQVTSNDATRRKQWDELVGRYEHITLRDSVGNAVVIVSRLGRYIYTALTWLEAARGGKTAPHQTFPTLEEARKWCVSQLAREGLTPEGACARSGLTHRSRGID